MSKTKTNKVIVVGRIAEIDTLVKSTEDGRNYITGKIVVKCVTSNNVENLVDVKVFAFERTKGGDVSKLYTSYVGLDKMLGKKVMLNCELREGNMVKGDGKLIKFNEIYLKFINTAKEDAEELISFEYSGFVVKSLYERRNADDELIGYRIEVAQANYNDSAIQVIRFDVDKEDVNIVEAISTHYVAGATVSFAGFISYISTVETKVEEVAFGNPIPKQIVKSEKSFKITAGNAPLDEDNAMAYSEEEIKKFIADYKMADDERIAKAQTPAEEPAQSTAASGMSKITRSKSLL